MLLRYKKLHPEARPPRCMTFGSAGFDLYSLERWKLKRNDSHLFRTGLQVIIPNGYCGVVYGRSGMALHYDINVHSKYNHIYIFYFNDDADVCVFFIVYRWYY